MGDHTTVPRKHHLDGVLAGEGVSQAKVCLRHQGQKTRSLQHKRPDSTPGNRLSALLSALGFPS